MLLIVKQNTVRVEMFSNFTTNVYPAYFQRHASELRYRFYSAMNNAIVFKFYDDISCLRLRKDLQCVVQYTT